MEAKTLLKIIGALDEHSNRGENSNQDLQTIHSHIISKIVMVRTYSAGVHFGTLLKKEGSTVLLRNAKRVHYWDGACSLSQLAMEGTAKPDNCRISIHVDEILLGNVIEIIAMSPRAIDNLFAVKEWIYQG